MRRKSRKPCRPFRLGGIGIQTFDIVEDAVLAGAAELERGFGAVITSSSATSAFLTGFSVLPPASYARRELFLLRSSHLLL